MDERPTNEPAGERRAPSRSRALRLAGRAFATVIILAVIYCDCSAIFRLSGIRAELPLHWFAYRMFAIFSVFEDAPASNRVFEAEALVRDSPESAVPPEWRSFDIYTYFPQHRGDANRRIERFGLWFEDAILRELAGEESRERDHALATLPLQLRARLERDRPDWHVEEVRVFEVSWPPSTKDYFTHRDRSTRKLLASGGDSQSTVDH